MLNISVILLDNIDSFTYNLVDEIRSLGVSMSIFRNTVSADIVLDALIESAKTKPTLLMLSPGPGAPSDAGCMPELLRKVKGKFPVIGICLGHQAIVELYTGKVERAPYVMHGKSSLITHTGTSVFTHMQNPLAVARYHSLAVSVVPDNIEVLASVDSLPMAIYQQDDKMLGFQFHPESILTCNGSELLMQSIEFLVSQGAH